MGEMERRAQEEEPERRRQEKVKEEVAGNKMSKQVRVAVLRIGLQIHANCLP